MAERKKDNPAFEEALALAAPLAQRLDHYAAALDRRNPAIAGAYQRLVDRLAGAGAGSGAPRVGSNLPAFVLPDETGKVMSLAGLLREGPLVISFNRGSWCPFCWLELTALAEAYTQVRELGAGIVSIMPETAAYSRKLKKRFQLPFPVLTDIDNGYGLELGLAIAFSAEVRTLLRQAGVDPGVNQCNGGWMAPIPATILVDRSGIVRKTFVDPDFRKRADPDAIVQALAAIS